MSGLGFQAGLKNWSGVWVYMIKQFRGILRDTISTCPDLYFKPTKLEPSTKAHRTLNSRSLVGPFRTANGPSAWPISSSTARTAATRASAAAAEVITATDPTASDRKACNIEA